MQRTRCESTFGWCEGWTPKARKWDPKQERCCSSFLGSFSVRLRLAIGQHAFRGSDHVYITKYTLGSQTQEEIELAGLSRANAGHRSKQCGANWIVSSLKVWIVSNRSRHHELAGIGLGIPVARSTYYSLTLGPNVGILYRHRSVGYGRGQSLFRNPCAPVEHLPCSSGKD